MKRTLVPHATWSASLSPHPQGRRDSVSGVTLTILGTQALVNPLNGSVFRQHMYKVRNSLRFAVVAGALVAALECGPARLWALLVAVLAAIALAMADPAIGVTDEIEELAANAMGVSEFVTVGGARLQCEGAKFTGRVIHDWVCKAKLHFGDLKDTPADRTVVKRWLAEQMKAADMRDKDAIALVPVVTELVWVPLESDVVAARVKRSKVVAAMKMLCDPSQA